jgi:hypothetical protein
MAAIDRSTAIGYANVNGLLTVCSAHFGEKLLEPSTTVSSTLIEKGGNRAIHLIRSRHRRHMCNGATRPRMLIE